MAVHIPAPLIISFFCFPSERLYANTGSSSFFFSNKGAQSTYCSVLCFCHLTTYTGNLSMSVHRELPCFFSFFLFLQLRSIYRGIVFIDLPVPLWWTLDRFQSFLHYRQYSNESNEYLCPSIILHMCSSVFTDVFIIPVFVLGWISKITFSVGQKRWNVATFI